MQLTPTDFAIVAMTAVAVVIAVTLHHRVSSWMVEYLDDKPLKQQRRMLHLIFFLILTHIVQIWMFAGTASLILRLPDSGNGKSA